MVTDPEIEDDMELEGVSERVIEGVSDSEGVMVSEELIDGVSDRVAVSELDIL